MNSSYHPQTDGQSEVLNRCLEMYLRCYTQQNPKEWYKLLPWANYWYNTTFQSVIGMTPYKAVFAQDPPPIIKYEPQPADNPMVQHQLQDRDRLLGELKNNLLKAQNSMKCRADLKRRDIQFLVGDHVFVKLQPYRQSSVVLRKNQKLSMRYFGPFEILERIGQVAYKLKLPDTAKIHPVFHISLLKKCEGAPQQQSIPVTLLNDDKGQILQPSIILDKRKIKRNGV